MTTMRRAVIRASKLNYCSCPSKSLVALMHWSTSRCEFHLPRFHLCTHILPYTALFVRVSYYLVLFWSFPRLPTLHSRCSLRRSCWRWRLSTMLYTSPSSRSGPLSPVVSFISPPLVECALCEMVLLSSEFLLVLAFLFCSSDESICATSRDMMATQGSTNWRVSHNAHLHTHTHKYINNIFISYLCDVVSSHRILNITP